MRKSTLYGAALAAMAFTLSVSAVQDQSIPDDDLGLYKASIYDTAEPAAFEYGSKDAGTVGKREARSYITAPPMIPHTIKDMVPITRDANLCKDCHAQPDLIGQKITPGIPVPSPVSHYANVKAGELDMSRWTCTQCHRPQADVKLLVESTFDSKTSKK